MSKKEFFERFEGVLVSYNNRPENSRGEMAAQAELANAGLLSDKPSDHLNENLVKIVIGDERHPEQRGSHMQTGCGTTGSPTPLTASDLPNFPPSLAAFPRGELVYNPLSVLFERYTYR